MDNINLIKEEFMRGEGQEAKDRIDRLETFVVILMEKVSHLEHIINPKGLTLPTAK